MPSQEPVISFPPLRRGPPGMTSTHPRRATPKNSSPALNLSPPSVSGRTSVNVQMSLSKCATFHSPHYPVADFKVPALRRRSQTTLEDVVDAHRRRVALTLADIDRSLAAIEEQLPDVKRSLCDEASPVTQGLLIVDESSAKPDGPFMDRMIEKEPQSVGRPAICFRHRGRASTQCSDSGLGSSIASVSGKPSTDTKPTSCTGSSITKSAGASAITRSTAATMANEGLFPLSAKASNRIREHILRPLLLKASLKDFWPIVKDCPRRFHTKEILCLRDLEKTLVFLAPKAKSAALYLDFCLESIRCIQATVGLLPDREQIRPSDRPYTAGYFVDLVHQIKQYAQQLQDSKDKQARGDRLDTMDAERSDEVKLYGGLSKNGRPAELIRVKNNGKAVSISTGEPIDLHEDNKSAALKRCLSGGLADDEEILRSMARRKSSTTDAELLPKQCRQPGCNKEFKRPCDLTKHEKTHSRPWKCSVETCKYHEYGWPTEKEMTRHHNDKHSAAPPLYECHFKPCPYRTKRESNCKQHMEKAHGWIYVRSKNNGKSNDSRGSEMIGLPTPQLTNIQTPSSDGNRVNTPSDDEIYDSSPAYRQDADMNTFPIQMQYSPVSNTNQSAPSSNNHSPAYMPIATPDPQQFQDNLHSFANNLAWDEYINQDLYNANMRMPTQTQYDVFNHIQQPFQTSGLDVRSEPAPHISPVGHGNIMLYNPTLVEVGEDCEEIEYYRPENYNINDFQLYPNSTRGSGASSSSGLFGEIPGTSCGDIQPAMTTHAVFPQVISPALLGFYAANTAAPMLQDDMPCLREDQFGQY